MNFPYIEHLDQIRDATQGRTEFNIMNKGDYIVANYSVKYDDTFPSLFDEISEEERLRRSILREIRGITFDKNGKTIRRTMQKYFNYMEKPEEVSFFDIKKEHVILEKLDGSMVSPFLVNNNLLYGTKAGVTDVSKLAEKFVNGKNNYFEFSMNMVENLYTPSFEFVSRKQRIVIDYEEENLILTAIRHMYTGEYIDISEMNKIAKNFDIPVVKTYGNIKNIDQFIQETKELIGMEGYVVRFYDGNMFKIKADEYCDIHHTVSYFESEKNSVLMVLEDKVDDVVGSLPDYKAEKLKKFNDDIHHFIIEKLKDIEDFTKQHVGKMTAKAFFGIISHDKQFEKFYMNAFRSMESNQYDFQQMYKNYLAHVIRQMGTLKKIEDNRHYIGGHKWDFHIYEN
jgi:T4 RnlA family RNA ligase